MLKRYGKIFLGICLCSTLLSFGGCGVVEDYAKEEITKQIIQKLDETDATYYEEYEENPITSNNSSDEAIATNQGNVIMTGSIHVTFANNSFLDISYYSDAELVNLIDTNSCYLEPEDCIYASVPVSNSAYSNMYSFSEYRVYEYDKDGNRVRVNWANSANSANTMVFQIPANYQGTELCVIPVGEYEKRSLSFQDYILNEKGQKIELSGKWIVNNESFYDKKKEISPIISYVVRYEYDNDLYYYISSNPECYYPNESGNTDGRVIFKEVDADETVNSYSVELHKYIIAVIANDGKGIQEILIDNQKVSTDITKDKIELGKLKCGTVVEIVTKQDYKVSSSDVDFSVAKQGLGAKTYYHFTFTVPETIETEINLEVSKWKEKNLKIEVDETTVKEKLDVLLEKLLDKGDKESILTLRTGDTVYTYQELQDGKTVTLSEQEDLIVSVNRSLLDECKVQISINNKEPIYVESSSESVRYVFKYDEVSQVRIVILSKTDDSVVQKGKLRIELDKKLDSNILFDVTQTGTVLVNDKGYIDTKNGKILYDGDFNAEKDIEISADHIQYYTNTALKLEIEKDGECEDIRYVQTAKLKETISAIKGDGFCNEIVVKISMVDVVKYTQHTQVGCTIQVQLTDGDKHILKNGEVLEDSRKVIVKIIPTNNYYIDGKKNITDGVYTSKEIKFSKYDIDEILKDYPVKKLIKVTLDISDPHGVGKVTYIVNKKEEIKITSIRFLKEDDKLEVRYEITELDYEIANSSVVSSIVPGGDSKTRKTWKIPVSTKLDGTKISVTQEDIQIEKKEN